jgi:hypothetical protein
VKYYFVDYFDFIDVYFFFQFIQNRASEWRKHVFIALFRNGVFYWNSINYLPLGRNDWRWTNRLFLFFSGKDGSGTCFTLIRNVILVISKRLLKLTECKMVLKVKGLIFFRLIGLKSLKSPEILNSVSKSLRNSLNLHWLIRLLIILTLPQVLRNINILKQRSWNRLEISTTRIILVWRGLMLIYINNLDLWVKCVVIWTRSIILFFLIVHF